jgi:hypothetical protein
MFCPAVPPKATPRAKNKKRYGRLSVRFVARSRALRRASSWESSLAAGAGWAGDDETFFGALAGVTLGGELGAAFFRSHASDDGLGGLRKVAGELVVEIFSSASPAVSG